MMYGEKIFVVNNVRGVRNAAYDRLKKGEFPSYKIMWKSRWEPIVEARMVLPSGCTHTHTYTFRLEDIIPVKLREKKLEDYL